MNLANYSRAFRLIRMLKFDPESKIGPLRVDICLTSACNYHCVFCGTHSYSVENQPFRYLNAETLRLLLKDLKELDTKEILFAGNGEPFLYPLLLNIVRDNYHDFKFEIMTNGSLLELLDKDTFGKLSKLTVSLNSGNGKTHPMTHGYCKGNHFYRIIKELQRLLGYRSAESKIELNYVITEDNRNELDDFIKTAKSWEVRYHARPVSPFTLASVTRTGELEACYMGFIQPSITADGVVPSCLGNPLNSLGNINTQSFKDIWQNNRAIRYSATRMDKSRVPVTPNCFGCANCVASSKQFHSIYSKLPVLGQG